MDVEIEFILVHCGKSRDDDKQVRLGMISKRDNDDDDDDDDNGQSSPVSETPA